MWARRGAKGSGISSDRAIALPKVKAPIAIRGDA
jgi:hypothetical protein